MDEKVREIKSGLLLARKNFNESIDNFEPDSEEWKVLQDINKILILAEGLFSLLSEKEKHEEDYQRIIKEILLCNPIPARKRQDDTLEPPWEVIARIRTRFAEKEKEIKELKESFHNLTEHLMETKRDLSFEIAHGLQAEKRIKELKDGIEKHKISMDDGTIPKTPQEAEAIDQELYKLIEKK